jgi:hypothetical protein
MAVDEQTRDALELKNLRLPSLPPIDRIECEEYEDSSGSDSLRLLVIFASDTDVEKITGQQAGDLKRAIRESLIAHGIPKFPYIFITTVDELAEDFHQE